MVIIPGGSARGVRNEFRKIEFDRLGGANQMEVQQAIVRHTEPHRPRFQEKLHGVLLAVLGYRLLLGFHVVVWLWLGAILSCVFSL